MTSHTTKEKISFGTYGVIQESRTASKKKSVTDRPPDYNSDTTPFNPRPQLAAHDLQPSQAPFIHTNSAMHNCISLLSSATHPAR